MRNATCSIVWVDAGSTWVLSRSRHAAAGEPQTLGDVVDAADDARADVGDALHDVGLAVDQSADRGAAAGAVDDLVAPLELDGLGDEHVDGVVDDADDRGGGGVELEGRRGVEGGDLAVDGRLDVGVVHRDRDGDAEVPSWNTAVSAADSLVIEPLASTSTLPCSAVTVVFAPTAVSEVSELIAMASVSANSTHVCCSVPVGDNSQRGSVWAMRLLACADAETSSVVLVVEFSSTPPPAVTDVLPPRITFAVV